MILFFEKIVIRGAAIFTKFILNLDAQLPAAFDADPLFMRVMTIHRQKQISYQTGIYLHHQSILASGDQMLNLQVTLPPSEEAFDFPSELDNLELILVVDESLDASTGIARQYVSDHPYRVFYGR